MSDQVAIRVRGVSKMYKMFPTRFDMALDVLGLARLLPWRRTKAHEFWAIRDLNLELKVGCRLGIVGRNGAGKSTLLKLITGNLPPTEGEILVSGQVQALLEAGAGFHPEFTGYENIRASLTYQGLSSKEIDIAMEDIAEFTELGQFLGQPFKTYSSGMQARLMFAAATVLKPKILIIDEVLGAGDAYFASRSAERMKQLVQESGASVLLVSHAMAQVLQYCDECIWLERGRIVMRGPSMEVVNAYEGFIHTLEDRRLKAKNRKRHSGHYAGVELDMYSEALSVAVTLQGKPGVICDVAEITLLKDGQVEEMLRVGDGQDASASYAASVVLDGSNWSGPRRGKEGYSRRLSIQESGPDTVRGYAAFYAYMLYDDAEYTLRVRYRCEEPARLWLAISRGGSPLGQPADLPTGRQGMIEWTVSLPGLRGTHASNVNDTGGDVWTGGGGRQVVRFPSEGSVVFERAVLLGTDDREQAVFPVGEPLVLMMIVVARRAGRYNLVPAATLFRLDGVFVSNLVGAPTAVELKEGETLGWRLDLRPLNLGDGHFVFSLSLFEGIVALDGSTRYDLLARAYEFQVVGNTPLASPAIFQHPGKWSVVSGQSSMDSA